VVVEAARETLVRLGARPFLARLDGGRVSVVEAGPNASNTQASAAGAVGLPT